MEETQVNLTTIPLQQIACHEIMIQQWRQGGYKDQQSSIHNVG